MGKESTERATASFAKKRERAEERTKKGRWGKDRYLFGRPTAHYMRGGLDRFGNRSALTRDPVERVRWYGYRDGTLFPFQPPHPVGRLARFPTADRSYRAQSADTTALSISICVDRQYSVLAASRDDPAWVISLDVVLTT